MLVCLRAAGRHVHHVLAGLEQTVRQGPAGTVAALNRLKALRPGFAKVRMPAGVP